MGSPSSGVDESRSVRFLGLLRVLLRHGVDFFVVGGVAAQLEGASILTLDLDVLLYDRASENLARLLAALREFNTRYRDPVGRHIEQDLGKRATLRMSLLLTDLGALDIMGAIGTGLTYQVTAAGSRDSVHEQLQQEQCSEGPEEEKYQGGQRGCKVGPPLLGKHLEIGLLGQS